MATEEPTDHSLLRRLRDGESDAATDLYFRYADHLKALVTRQSSPALQTRVDPEDIVQSVFRTFFRRVIRDHYDVPKGEDLWKLILVIGLNKIRNLADTHQAAKRDARRTVSLAEMEAVGAGPAARSEEAVDTLRHVITELLEPLPVDNRRIIELRIEGHDIREIAERTGRARRSIERILQDFRQRLASELNDEDSVSHEIPGD